jgi:hypothetical protein
LPDRRRFVSGTLVPGTLLATPGRLKPTVPPTFVFWRLGSLSGTVTVPEPRYPTGPIWSPPVNPSCSCGALGTFTFEPAAAETDGPKPIPNSGTMYAPCGVATSVNPPPRPS